MDVRERIFTHCKELLPQWADLPNDTFTIRNFASTSNLVYLVSTTENVVPSQVIYREFGAAEIVDIAQERSLFDRLSALGYGPFSYGSTATYRVEEYIPGRSLDRLELRDANMLGRICKALRGLHQQDLSALADPSHSVTVINAERWREICQKRLPALSLSAEDLSEVQSLLSDSLWSQFLSLLPSTSLVFSHHDCNELNFLFIESQDRVRPIDYEYSGYSWRGMDLALTINELLYCYTHPEPPFWSYHIQDLHDDAIITQYVKAYGGDAEVWAETRLCLCVGHFHWALWSVAMHKEGQRGFDYIKYAVLRLNDFRREMSAIESLGGIEGIKARAIAAMSG